MSASAGWSRSIRSRVEQAAGESEFQHQKGGRSLKSVLAVGLESMCDLPGCRGVICLLLEGANLD